MNRILVALFFVLLIGTAFGAQPPPEFSTGHELPPTAVPPPQALIYEYLDVALLGAAMAVAAYLALRKRRRRGLLVLSILSLFYFGFWRGGCICPVGAVQNCVLTIADSGYAMPLTVLAFFLLPLVFALFFGRVFCSSVCPLGAIQDVVLTRPVKVPAPLAHALGLLAYVYLGGAVLFAAMGSAFIICRYDPFIAIFRLSGTRNMLLLGAAFLVVAVFVGRPYCRFLCPYSVLLKWLSRVSKWHVSITPDECVNCRLCEDACPFGAITKPTPAAPARRTEGKKRLAILLMIFPVIVAAGALLGRAIGPPMAWADPTVQTADLVWEFQGKNPETLPDEVIAFRKAGRPRAELFREADDLKRKYNLAGWILGAWVGIVIGGKLIALATRRTRTEYEADRAECVTCGRCFSYCPRERLRLKKPDADT
ncbi:MAG: 4Fe-4S binding protein [Planctomycetes bacterium]|nr:4Fe-4S binding protein [Planctomycetota bacterium]